MTIFVTDLLFEKPLANDRGVITFNAEYKQYFANFNQNSLTAHQQCGYRLLLHV